MRKILILILIKFRAIIDLDQNLQCLMEFCLMNSVCLMKDIKLNSIKKIKKKKKDVKKLMKYSFIAYVVISLPLSYVLGILLDGGALGIWMAFPFGLSTAAVLYLRRFLKVSKIQDR